MRILGIIRAFKRSRLSLHLVTGAVVVVGACSLVVDKKLSKKPLSADMVIGECKANSDCNDFDTCNGEETCDPETKRCVPGTGLSDSADCQVPEGGAGKCVRKVCIPVNCGDGVIDSINEDCDTSLDASCPQDCVYECQSGVRPSRGCASGLTCTNKRCVQAQTSIECPQTPPNKCLSIVYDSNTGKCTYRPIVLSKREPIASEKVMQWISTYGTVSCASQSCTNYNRYIGQNNWGPGNDPYCQFYGPVDAPTCFNAYDYNCDGTLNKNPDLECDADNGTRSSTCHSCWTPDTVCGGNGRIVYCYYWNSHCNCTSPSSKSDVYCK